MLVDLVQTITRDGVRLDGMYQQPAGSSTIGVDAFCLLHGTGGNFYSSSLFDSVTEHLQKLGSGVLRVNTRGHDGLSTAVTAQGGRRQGAAYEIVEDCRHDLAAWFDWLRRRVGPRIGLVGHSLGAVKAIYALAQEPSQVPACLIGLSPPRLSYASFCTSAQGPHFLEIYQQAEQFVQNGQPTALLEVKLPLPYVVTAAGFVEKYGPEERYNFLNFVGGVRCPTLLTFGSVEMENNMAFHGVPDEIAALRTRPKQLTVETIAGADHFYTGVRQALVTSLDRWLRGLPGEQGA